LGQQPDAAALDTTPVDGLIVELLECLGLFENPVADVTIVNVNDRTAHGRASVLGSWE
jgi:hypothetical protein